MKIKSTLLLLVALVGMNSAFAMPINGSISWEGDFSRVGDVFSFSNVEINDATGDFATAGFFHNEALVVADLDIGAFAPVVLWAKHGITFTLNRIDVLLDMPALTAIRGGATVSGAGFDDSSYTLFFSTSLSNFSATAVPEPATGLLLIGGLAGLMIQRRRNVRAAA